MPSNLVYVGTYTDPSRQAGFEVTPATPVMGMTGPTGSEGLYVYQHDPESGELSHLHTVAGVVNPSFLALDPGERFLFAVNESRDFDETESGAVSSFAIDPDTGDARFLSQVPTGGGNPCHLSVSPSGRYLLVANHEHGRLSVLPIDGEGYLSPPTDIVQNERRDPGGERRPHAHFITPDPSGEYVLSTDTGTDRVSVYRLDQGSGRLQPNLPPWGETHPGGSPRHLAFHPGGDYLYANGEADLTLTVFRYDATSGTLDHLHYVSTIPDGVTGPLSTAQLLAHPNGRFVYVANRGHDSIAVFRVDPSSGKVTLVTTEPTLGRTPRNFMIDPSGRFLYAANQNSDSIVCFTIDQETGRLTPSGHVTYVPAPTCVIFTQL